MDNYQFSISNYSHFADHETLPNAIIGFAQFVRRSNYNIGMQETLDALDIAGSELIHEKESLRYALKSVFSCSREDAQGFDAIFDSYWRSGGSEVWSKIEYKNKSITPEKTSTSVVLMGHGSAGEGIVEARNISGANAEERLRNTDFAKLEEIDTAYLEEIAMRMWKQMSFRLKRRIKSARKGDRIDLRQTIRRNIAHGGDPIELRMKSKKRRKEKLVVFLDVSGSMDKYSLFLLKFIWSLKQHFEKIEAFIFSTSLVRITDYLEVNSIEQTLSTLTRKVDSWSSGTRIGACLDIFNEQHAKRVLHGRSSVIILSDGLDTGEPERLSDALRRVRLRTKRIIWLNPLKGTKDFQPIQRGMKAALGEIDVLRSAHSINSLLELEELLVHV